MTRQACASAQCPSRDHSAAVPGRRAPALPVGGRSAACRPSAVPGACRARGASRGKGACRQPARPSEARVCPGLRVTASDPGRRRPLGPRFAARPSRVTPDNRHWRPARCRHETVQRPRDKVHPGIECCADVQPRSAPLDCSRCRARRSTSRRASQVRSDSVETSRQGAATAFQQ